MTVRRTALAAWPRSVLMTLALLALAVRVLVPPGYMTPDRPTSGFSLVICTDHGLVTLDDDGKQAPPGKPKGDAPCAFAGGMAPPAPTVAVLTSFEGWAPAPLRVEPRQDLAPGRGLAAPPPPAIGPPVLI